MLDIYPSTRLLGLNDFSKLGPMRLTSKIRWSVSSLCFAWRHKQPVFFFRHQWMGALCLNLFTGYTPNDIISPIIYMCCDSLFLKPKTPVCDWLTFSRSANHGRCDIVNLVWYCQFDVSPVNYSDSEDLLKF